MKLALTIPALLLAACATPAPICDREAVEWNKWGTTLVPAECAEPRPIARPTPLTHSNDRDRPRRPTPDQPDDPKPTPEPKPEPVNPPVHSDPKPGKPTKPEKPRGNPGNHKPVGNAGENPGKGGHEAGGGSRGMSDNPNKGKNDE